MKPADLAEKVGGQTHVVVDRGVGSQQVADQMASAVSAAIGSAAFEATAVTTGSPDLKAGVAVNVGGVDPALAGKWVISGSRHEFGDGFYRTSLEFAGRQDRSVHGLLAQGSGAGSDRIYGLVIGDRHGQQRPRQHRPGQGQVPVAGRRRRVVVGADRRAGRRARTTASSGCRRSTTRSWWAFQHGDVRMPYVLGGLWNGVDPIPFDNGANLDAGSVTFCGFKSRTGHQINFWESGDDSSIQLLTKGGAIEITLDELNSELKIEVQGKVSFEADGDVEIKAGGSMKLEATGQMTVKGATVAIN